MMERGLKLEATTALLKANSADSRLRSVAICSGMKRVTEAVTVGLRLLLATN